MIKPGKIYFIINAKSRTVIDLCGSDNSSIIGWPIHGGDNQKWHIEGGNGKYTVRSVRTGRYIGITTEAKGGVGAVAVSFRYEWEVRPDKDDPTLYRFFVPGTAFNLDLTNYGSSASGTPIAVYAQGNGKHQCWRLDEC
ncbi:carbohydrate-binding module family 13 protein [Amanita thiersii Skay4041]|uniref:Carbohydrate-binding module family 13 protein n=1 Tax=Amanita thiersii Skay4041 TaxID=703135 RepID=A0A2A9NIY8_9AGAR|nr:carbohydrate-binding module family 13 protein [Amanita thiersii Skay4041]